MSLSVRCEQVSTAVAAIESNQEVLKPLTPILSSSDNLLKSDQLLSGYKKKLTDLSQVTESSRTQTLSLAKKVQDMVNNADQTLSEIVAKRQKEARLMEAKAGNIENVYKQLQQEGQIAAKQLQVLLKEEAIEISTNFEHRLVEERAGLMRKLESTKTIQTEAVTAAREEAKRCIQELTEYGKDNSEKLGMLKSSTPVSQSSRMSSEDAKSQILSEVSGRLSKGIQTIKEQMDAKCGIVGTKYTEELMRLRTEVEATRDVILGQRGAIVTPTDQGPLAKLKRLNSEVRRLLNHIGAFCTKGLEGVTDTTKSIHGSLQLIDQMGISEQGQKLLQESETQLQTCTQQVSDIATKVKADFYGVQEAVKEGHALLSVKNLKLPPDQKPSFDVQKDVRSRLEKEFTRERVEKLLADTQEDLRTLQTGYDHWKKQLTHKDSPFEAQEDENKSEEDFEDI